MRLWLLDEDEGFSVKSLYSALAHCEAISFPSRFIWNNIIPPKISFFTWLLWWDHILTLDNLIRGGLIIPNR